MSTSLFGSRVSLPNANKDLPIYVKEESPPVYQRVEGLSQNGRLEAHHLRGDEGWVGAPPVRLSAESYVTRSSFYSSDLRPDTQNYVFCPPRQAYIPVREYFSTFAPYYVEGYFSPKSPSIFVATKGNFKAGGLLRLGKGESGFLEVRLDGVCEEGRDFVSFKAISTRPAENRFGPGEFTVVVLKSCRNLRVRISTLFRRWFTPSRLRSSEVFGAYPAPVEINVGERGEGRTGSLDMEIVRESPEVVMGRIVAMFAGVGFQLERFD